MKIYRKLQKILLLAAMISCSTTYAQDLTTEQIEEIARAVAAQSNANKESMLDEMTASFNAVATGKNIRFESAMRVAEGVTPGEISKWFNETQTEIIRNVCAQNEGSPAFDSGLSYTFSYSNTHGEKLGDVFVDKSICNNQGQ